MSVVVKAQELARARGIELAELRRVAARTLNAYHAVVDNLTRVQARCSELLQENRRLRRDVAELRAAAELRDPGSTGE